MYTVLMCVYFCCSSAPFFPSMLNKQMPKVTLKNFRKISLNDLFPKEHTYATRIVITTNANRKKTPKDRTGVRRRCCCYRLRCCCRRRRRSYRYRCSWFCFFCLLILCFYFSLHLLLLLLSFRCCFPPFLHLLFRFSLNALQVAHILYVARQKVFHLRFPIAEMQRQHGINHPRIRFIYSSWWFIYQPESKNTKWIKKHSRTLNKRTHIHIQSLYTWMRCNAAWNVNSYSLTNYDCILVLLLLSLPCFFAWACVCRALEGQLGLIRLCV